MDVDAELLRVDRECRRILGRPLYTKETSAQLIEWLRHSNAAISDIAGRCLIKFGTPAYDDLLAVVVASGPWPDAIWVLSAISPASDELLPLLRAWMSHGAAEIKRQSVVSLACSLVERKKAGLALAPEDVAACLKALEGAAPVDPSMRLRLREFRAGMASD